MVISHCQSKEPLAAAAFRLISVINAGIDDTVPLYRNPASGEKGQIWQNINRQEKPLIIAHIE